jgi:hypothetical protein
MFSSILAQWRPIHRSGFHAAMEMRKIAGGTPAPPNFAHHSEL